MTRTPAQTRELALIRNGRYSDLKAPVKSSGMNADGSMWVTYGRAGWSGQVTISAAGEISHM
jgi:hypothetical protein